jgi:hypothetical protein
VLQALPISILSILSPARIWVRSADHSTPHYVIFSIPPLQNKYTNCKGVKNNTNFGKITGIQEKLDTTYK